MNSRKRNHVISPAGSNPECIARRSQISCIGNILITNQEMAPRMAALRMMDICNMKPSSSRPGPSSRKKEVAVDMPVTDEHDEFLMERKVMRRTYVDIQRMIEAAVQVFQKPTTDRQM